MSKQDDADAYWAKLLGQAQMNLLGASDVELKVQLYDVLEEFFDGSNCWQESLSFMVIPNTLDYPLSVLTGQIRRLYGVLDQNNVAQPAVMPVIGTVRFLYPYTITQPMTAVVIKTLAHPLECYPPYIPDWILPTHGLGILHGVIGNMMEQVGQSYSNPQLALFHGQKFRDAIAHARVAMMKMNTVGAQAWAFPQQFKVFGQKGGVSTFNVHPTPR
jgi:hypothetical protein